VTIYVRHAIRRVVYCADIFAPALLLTGRRLRTFSEDMASLFSWLSSFALPSEADESGVVDAAGAADAVAVAQEVSQKVKAGQVEGELEEEQKRMDDDSPPGLRHRRRDKEDAGGNND
jgi:hypothetical protein